MAYEVINSALAAGAKSVAGTVVISKSRNAFATSKKASGEERNASIKVSVRAFGKTASTQNVMTAKRLNGMHAGRLAKRTAELANIQSSIGRIKNGKYDIVYMQQPAGLLMSMVNEMACMGNVETGSFLTGKLGTKISDGRLTMYDDGKSNWLIDSSPFDDEGFPTKKTRLIEDGKLLTYLHNNSTATKYNVESTGNAGLVMPNPNTSVIEHKNTVPFDKMISRLDKGILVTNSWYTRFSNYLSGDFSTVPRDLAVYVEHGEPKFAIRQLDVSSATGIRISDNMMRMLKNVECAADDSIQTGSWDAEDYFVTPSILVKDVKVTTA